MSNQSPISPQPTDARVEDELPGRQPAPSEPPPLDHAPVPPLTAPEETEGG